MKLCLQAAQKISEARRTKIDGAEAYSSCTLTRNRLSATKPMSFFQQPAREKKAQPKVRLGLG